MLLVWSSINNLGLRYGVKWLLYLDNILLGLLIILLDWLRWMDEVLSEVWYLLFIV